MKHSLLNLTKKTDITPQVFGYLYRQVDHYLTPFLTLFSNYVDKRYISTFHELFLAILKNRNSTRNLLLSELGSFVAGGAHAKAGTKRISNLLHCKTWDHNLIREHLHKQADQRVSKMLSMESEPLLLWDGSCLEKHESIKHEALCPVASSKAQRLARIKPGYYTPPTKKYVFVPGFHIEGIALTALNSTASIFEMNVWTSRGKYKEWPGNYLWNGFKYCQENYGNHTVLHVFDRGYAHSTLLEYAAHFQQNFLVRWKKNHHLIDEKGTRATYMISRGCKNKSFKITYDKERKRHKHNLITWKKVKHPFMGEMEYTLIIVREKEKNSPMYFLTNKAIETKNQAWKMLFSYMKRWEVEEIFRCCKSELGIQSIRMKSWYGVQKMISILVLCYNFLVEII